MKKLNLAKTVLTVLLAVAARERPALACAPTPLPTLDCTAASSPCCADDATDPSIVWPANASWNTNNTLCGEAILWSKVSDQCTPDTVSRHDVLFDIDQDSYSSYGYDQCDPTLDYGKHWLGSYLIATSIDYQPGKTWHHPIQDYLAEATAQTNDYHDDAEHLHKESNAKNAEFFPAPFDEDEITFYCPLFGMSWPGTEVYRASDFIHEARHDFLDHANTNPGQDNYNANDHVLAPGHLNDRVNPTSCIPAPHSPCPPPLYSTVYQTQYEFMCDIDTTPADWLPRELAWEAGQVSAQMLTKYSGVSVFTSPPPIFCDTRPPLRRDPHVLDPGSPIRIRTTIDGNMHFEDLLDTDDDAVSSGEHVETFLPERSYFTNAPVIPWHYETPKFDDDMQATVDITYQSTVTCRPDDPMAGGFCNFPQDAVVIHWTAQFFEDGDHEDTQTGSVILDSENFDAPPQQVNLHCCSTDHGDLVINFQLDW